MVLVYVFVVFLQVVAPAEVVGVVVGLTLWNKSDDFGGFGGIFFLFC